MSLHRVAIVGSAGRGEDAARMTKAVFNAVVAKCNEIVEAELRFAKTQRKCLSLVSGGSAWVDHAAVVLFLKRAKEMDLTLYMPCKVLSNEFDKTAAAGQTLNRLHKQCSEIVGRKTIAELVDASTVRGSTFVVMDGFHRRNTAIATQCDILVAFSWEEGKEPKRGGGTWDTWQKCPPRCRKIHIPISSLLKSAPSPSEEKIATYDIIPSFPPESKLVLPDTRISETKTFAPKENKPATGFSFREVTGDLFHASPKYALAHCVSQDLQMGKGIAVEFKRKFQQVESLRQQDRKVGEVAWIRADSRHVFYMVRT